MAVRGTMSRRGKPDGRYVVVWNASDITYLIRSSDDMTLPETWESTFTIRKGSDFYYAWAQTVATARKTKKTPQTCHAPRKLISTRPDIHHPMPVYQSPPSLPQSHHQDAVNTAAMQFITSSLRISSRASPLLTPLLHPRFITTSHHLLTSRFTRTHHLPIPSPLHTS